MIFKASGLLRAMGIDVADKRHQAILEMQKNINQLGSIEFKIEMYPDGSWAAESVNVDGIISGGRDTKEINAMLKDAIFTYFDVPSYLCDDNLLRAPNEPVTVGQHVWAAR